MALVTTPGAADANSYATIAEADAYHTGHLYASGWNSAASGVKEAALVMATRLLDAMPGAWTGAASSEVQALGWPRTGMLSRNGFEIGSGIIPNNLKNAEAEFARQLIGSDLTESNSIVAQGITSLSAGPVSLSFAQSQEQYLALRQKDAQNAIIPDAVRMLLVPSWLEDIRVEDAEFRGMIFETL